MAATMTIFKIMPGKTREYLDFAREMKDVRPGEHAASRRRLGIATERVWIEPTNAGDVLLYYLEGDDLEKSFRGLADSKDSFDVWFKGRFLDITGVDLGRPEAVELGELVFESPRLHREGTDIPLATVMPIQPGFTNEWRAWLGELLVSREDEYRGYLVRYGLGVEKVFLVRTPAGRMGIVYAEGDNPAGAIAKFAKSHHPFDAWMREEMLYLNGIDFIRRATAPAPDLVLDWKAEPRRAAA